MRAKTIAIFKLFLSIMYQSITRQFLQMIFPKAFPCLAIDSTIYREISYGFKGKCFREACYTLGKIKNKKIKKEFSVTSLFEG